ncbi:hypothetical protein Tsubulata_022781 [Turnera subulata]|uniref:Endonuclease/exonuclease/phosphatase domain-containing protein n=1 Tax=Turnera subulata TaxID=218843 RepID=A0A9Q0F4J1_9ROSI|nr:hypothetical protein Tsubulata_022781 [Turnera subulata]
MISILSWNIRGLGSTIKHSHLKELISQSEAKIVCLCETKKQGIDRNLCSRLWNTGGLEFRAVDAEGASGGLLMMWDDTFFHVSQVQSNRNWILVEGRFSAPSATFCVCFVYGASSVESRIEMWKELKGLKPSFKSPRLLIGDLNETINTEDRRSKKLNRRRVGALKSFMDALQLIEFPLIGRKFTWSRNHEASRINRAMAQPE